MRKPLQSLNGQRLTIHATISRFGTKPGWHGATLSTVLLLDVRRSTDNTPLTDHLWFTCGKQFAALHLQPGDRIQLDARVTPYEKGYHGRRAEATGEAWSALDYRLERPTRIHKLQALSSPS